MQLSPSSARRRQNNQDTSSPEVGLNHIQKRCRQSLCSILPITSKNFDNSLVWSNTIGICGRNVVKCLPLSPIQWENAERLKSPKRIKPKRNLGGGSQSINKHLTNVKATIAKEVVLAYPDFMKPFEIYTDASTMQLGSVITQGNRPIVFFRRKLSVTQTKYSFTKIELLAIV